MTLFIGEENGSRPRVDWPEPGERVLPHSSLKKSYCRADVLRNARDLNFSFVASPSLSEHASREGIGATGDRAVDSQYRILS